MISDCPYIYHLIITIIIKFIVNNPNVIEYGPILNTCIHENNVTWFDVFFTHDLFISQHIHGVRVKIDIEISCAPVINIIIGFFDIS